MKLNTQATAKVMLVRTRGSRGFYGAEKEVSKLVFYAQSTG